MFSNFHSRIGRKASSTVLAAAIGLSLAFGTGAVHAQPISTGYTGDPCYINGYGPFPDGSIHFFNGVTQICKGGVWETYIPGKVQVEPTGGPRHPLQNQTATRAYD